MARGWKRLTMVAVAMIGMLVTESAFAKGVDFQVPGDGQSGSPHIYTDHGDGTATDHNTGLTWELKDSGDGIHGINRTFTWTNEDIPFGQGHGTVFSELLPALNNTCAGDQITACSSNDHCSGIGSGLCGLGGRRDWRLPTVIELQTLLDFTRPFIRMNLPGVVSIDERGRVGTGYWALTYTPEGGNEFFVVNFDGSPSIVPQVGGGLPIRARAVRGGRTPLSACVFVTYLPANLLVCPCGHGACGRDPLCEQYPQLAEVLGCH